MEPDDQTGSDGHAGGDFGGLEGLGDDDVSVKRDPHDGEHVGQSHEVHPETLECTDIVPPEVEAVVMGCHGDKGTDANAKVSQQQVYDEGVRRGA